MRHELHLHKIGPINDCRLTLDTFTILTGPQANGKSTVAKAVYFFRSVKQDILSIMMQGGPKGSYGGNFFSLAHRSKATNEGQVFAAFRNVMGHAIRYDDGIPVQQ